MERYDTTENLRRSGRVVTVYVAKEMSHVYLPEVGMRLVQCVSISELSMRG